MSKNFGIVELYCGASGKIGFYNNQELGIAKAMTKRGYKCFVFYPDIENKEISEEVYDDVTVVRCPAKHIGVHSFYDWNILKKYGITYVQIDSDNQFFAPDVIRFCGKNDIRFYNFIGTIKSDSDNPIKNMISSFMIRRNIACYKRSKCFVKTRQVLKDIENVGVKNAEVVHVGLDLSLIPEITDDVERIKKDLNIPLDKQVLLFVGRMESYKRPFDMLNIMKSVDDSFFGIMIGTGSLSQEIDKIIEDELKDKVRRIDKIENTKIHQYYKVSDYFLNFNEKEIFGMSMLEAMYQGCNVIALRSPGAEEIIDDERTGHIVSNIDDMVTIIDIGKHFELDTLRMNIIDNFSWDKSADAFDKCLIN